MKRSKTELRRFIDYHIGDCLADYYCNWGEYGEYYYIDVNEDVDLVIARCYDEDDNAIIVCKLTHADIRKYNYIAFEDIYSFYEHHINIKNYGKLKTSQRLIYNDELTDSLLSAADIRGEEDNDLIIDDIDEDNE